MSGVNQVSAPPFHFSAEKTVAVGGRTGGEGGRSAPLARVIDRRFSRSRHDITRTLEAFAATLPTELDLSELSGRPVGVVQDTMHPAHVSLWLRVPQPPVRLAGASVPC